jgi:hypothetical protein
LSYAVVERKKEVRRKVDGGSMIEVVSAGREQGNVAKIIVNNQQILTAHNSMGSSLNSATMSSNYRKGDLDAEAAIALDKNEKTYFHTKCGEDEWWSAQFNHKTLVTEVKIQNRADGDDATIKRLSNAEITVEGQYCGSIPKISEAKRGGEWFTVKCEKPVAGSNIMVRNTMKTCLHFSSISVTGFKMEADGSRGINVVALDARDHTVLMAKAYDTYVNDNASSDMIRDLNGVRRGSIIIAAVRDEGSRKFSAEARALFTKWGSAEA